MTDNAEMGTIHKDMMEGKNGKLGRNGEPKNWVMEHDFLKDSDKKTELEKRVYVKEWQEIYENR